MAFSLLLSSRKELVDFGCELVGVLEEKAMVSVWTDDEFGVGEVASQ